MIFHVVGALMGRGNQTMKLSYSAPFFDDSGSSGDNASSDAVSSSSSTGIPPLGDGGK
jgi:hypothetical protein